MLGRCPPLVEEEADVRDNEISRRRSPAAGWKKRQRKWAVRLRSKIRCVPVVQSACGARLLWCCWFTPLSAAQAELCCRMDETQRQTVVG